VVAESNSTILSTQTQVLSSQPSLSPPLPPTLPYTPLLPAAHKSDRYHPYHKSSVVSDQCDATIEIDNTSVYNPEPLSSQMEEQQLPELNGMLENPLAFFAPYNFLQANLWFCYKHQVSI
jgi:hypothetical protein